MKVQALTEALRFVGKVQSKADKKERNPSRKNHDEKHSHSDEPPQEQSFAEMTEKELGQKLDAAIGDFTNDEQAQANGLSAATVGEGPGLRVVLKGADGTVVRQFTGEEFMRMREAVGKDHRTRGKILDRKL